MEQHNKLLVEQLSSTEIDTNIWKKAKKIAEDQEEPKEDITHLIDFVSEKLHNLDVQIEEEEIGRKNTKLDIKTLIADQKETAFILEKLKKVREKFIRARPVEKKGEGAKKEKKYSWSAAEEKRKDDINEKCKARHIMLSTNEGWNKLRSQIVESHMAYTFQLWYYLTLKSDIIWTTISISIIQPRLPSPPDSIHLKCGDSFHFWS